jgi:hypothetical protein
LSIPRLERRSYSIDQLRVTSPPFVLVEQHQPERRGVDRAVVRRVGNLAGPCQLTLAQLVQDLARLRVAPVVNLGRLQPPEDGQGGSCNLRPDAQQLEARDQRVAAEETAEPRHAGSDIALALGRTAVEQESQVGAGPLECTRSKHVRRFDDRRARAPCPMHGLGLIRTD